MERQKALQHFMETYAVQKGHSSRQALDDYYIEHWQQLIPGFNQAFIKLCSKIKQAQQQGRKGKIRYIYGSFLYSSLQAGKAMYRLDAYNREWFFDKVECAVYYDAHWAYQFLHDLYSRLNVERKKYAGRVTVYGIDLLQREEAFHYGIYVESLAIQAMQKGVQSPEFAAISKEDTVEIFIGEYKDECQRIYRYSKAGLIDI